MGSFPCKETLQGDLEWMAAHLAVIPSVLLLDVAALRTMIRGEESCVRLTTASM